MVAELAAELDARAQVTQAVAFTLDGKTLVAAGPDDALSVWGMPGAWPRPALFGHGQAVSRVSVSADGEHVATSGLDDTVRVWSIKNGRCEHVFNHQQAGEYAPDGRVLMSHSDMGRLCLWSADDGRLLRVVPNLGQCVTATCWSPAGAYILVAVDGTLVRVDRQTGEIVNRQPAHEGAVHGLAVSPDGLMMASTGEDGRLVFWNTDQWRPVGQMVLDGEACGKTPIAWDPRGRWLAVGTSTGCQLVRRWPLAVVDTVGEGHIEGGLAWSPDGKWLAAAAEDGHLQVWRVRHAA